MMKFCRFDCHAIGAPNLVLKEPCWLWCDVEWAKSDSAYVLSGVEDGIQL